MSQIRNEAVGLQAGALALLTSVLWGGNPVAIKMGLDGVPPAAMAGLRFALGALTVWVGALFAGIPLRVPASEWKGLGGLASLFALQIWLLNAGTGYTTASRSAVVINVYPFFTALFAHLLVGDRLGLGKWLGFAFSFAGVLLLFWESVSFAETGYLLGDAMVAASGLLLGLRQVVIKRLVQGLTPYQVLFWQAMLSLPLFAASRRMRNMCSVARSSRVCFIRASWWPVFVLLSWFFCCVTTRRVGWRFSVLLRRSSECC